MNEVKPQTIQIKHWLGRVLYECEIPEEVESGFALRHALEQATAADADLSGADLSGADLSDAVLRGAVLRDADLSGAVLSDADLSGAVLRDADGSLRATPEQAIENLDRVRAIILDNNDRLEMGHWHQNNEWQERTCAEETLCGTTHCLAGWLQVCSTNEGIRKLDDPEIAGILSAPVAAKMFFRQPGEVLKWLENRDYAVAHVAA